MISIKNEALLKFEINSLFSDCWSGWLEVGMWNHEAWDRSIDVAENHAACTFGVLEYKLILRYRGQPDGGEIALFISVIQSVTIYLG
jgi:hypothetical protein